MALKEHEQALMDYRHALHLNPNDSRTKKKIHKLIKVTGRGKGIQLINNKWESSCYKNDSRGSN